MKHIELLNPQEVLKTHTSMCETGDECYICEVDCSCDTYTCGVDACNDIDCVVDCVTCNVDVDTCGIDVC